MRMFQNMGRSKALRLPYGKYIARVMFFIQFPVGMIILALTNDNHWLIGPAIVMLISGLSFQYRALTTFTFVDASEAIKQSKLLLNFIKLGGLFGIIGGFAGALFGILLGQWVNYNLLHYFSKTLIACSASIFACICISFGLYFAMLLVYSNDRDSN
jgi:hypothetical protein